MNLMLHVIVIHNPINSEVYADNVDLDPIYVIAKE